MFLSHGDCFFMFIFEIAPVWDGQRETGTEDSMWDPHGERSPMWAWNSQTMRP